MNIKKELVLDDRNASYNKDKFNETIAKHRLV